MLDALLTQFLIAAMRSTAPAAAAPASSLLVDFERLLEAAFAQHHDVGYYAAVLDVTADHLSAITRAHHGISAKTLIDRRLFRAAAQSLATSRGSVAEVGATLGFDEPSHFTRFFRRMSGEPPAVFRRRRHHLGIRQQQPGY
jgi:AraC family transcriptional activator of pobA